MTWPPDPGAIGKRVAELDTPCLRLDLDKLERNLDRMAALFAERRVRVRPHAKTHKVPNVALMQLARGAIGVCCAKLGEAEVLAAGGVSGLLITTEIIGAPKIRRLLGLAQQVQVITVVDDAWAAEQLSEAAVAASLRLRCLVDVNVGQNRAGVAPGEPALALAQHVDRLPGLELVGLQGYHGLIQHIRNPAERRQADAAAMRLVSDTVELLLGKGLRMEIVSTAGTGTCLFAADWPHITEVQPGSYVVMDADYGQVQGLGFENALTVLTSVLSKRGNEVIIDAGHKALSGDAGPAWPKDLDATYATGGDEHGKLTFANGNPLALGDTVEMLPSHCDTTINLYDLYYVTRGDRVVAVWPIAARGRVQ